MKEKILTLNRKDFTIQTFKSGGKGGQHQNKVDSGVRIIHKESGAVGECRNNRSQLINKRTAFQRLTNSTKFKLWLNRMIYEITGGKTIEERVEEQLEEKNIKIEIKDEKGRWADETGNGRTN